jgi:putative heme-binding domain-containing protein
MLSFVLTAVAFAFAPFAGLAQNAPEKERSNPAARNIHSIEAGKALYVSRETLCSNCHGADARGGEASNLYTSRVILRESDQRLFEVIKEGIPGTGMPPQPGLSDEQVWQMAAYLQDLARPGRQAPVAGDPRHGARLFDDKGCRGCHMIQGAGGFLGPDLSDAALRLSTEELRRSIFDPAAEMRDGFRAVTVITPGGQRVTGLRKNDSNFSIEILRPDGTYFLTSRARVRELPPEPQTLMPSDFRFKLSPGDIQDLLAFLDQQRTEGRSAGAWLIKAH